MTSSTTPLRLCLQPDCKVLVARGYCKDHKRPSAAKRGYDRRWQAYRRMWAAQHPLCGDRIAGPSAEHSECRRDGLDTPMKHVDHIIPVTGPDDRLFYDPSNHQSLCVRCHAAKTANESASGSDVGRITVICGAPGAGKRAYVSQHRKVGDLVWDLDAIADVIAQCPEYPRPPHVATCTSAMRDAFVRVALRVRTRVFIIIVDEFAAARVHAELPGARLLRLTRRTALQGTGA